MLTAAQVRQEGLSDVELTLVTPESEPLEIFGRRASEAIGALLGDAGLELRTGSHPRRFADGLLSLDKGERSPASG